MTAPRDARSARRLLATALFGLLGGIALAATGSPTAGGLIATACLGGAAYALHAFGRTGPDLPAK